MTDRIFFAGNPWPKGHRIKKFSWTGSLDPERGIRFEFDLETDDYYAESEGNDAEDEGDWKSTVVWGNYHRCHLHANQGFLAGTVKNKLSLEELTGRVFKVDTRPKEWDDAAFHVYLLGHDSVAAHEITFGKRKRDGSFQIDWTGKICLSYAGRTKYQYRFEVHIASASFGGISVPEELDGARARAALASCVVDVSDWRLRTNGKRRVFASVRSR